ncbi:type VII secretion protein EccCa [Pseudonocardia sp.]|uniref:type VII secretion protein EccCa n=1 Tax=Pseudonocardia sp. TaxID=60912 RepID=UPI003D0C2E4E
MPRTVVVARPPRAVPRPPSGRLQLEPPPEPERVVPTGLVQRLLPVVMIAGSLGFVAVLGPSNPTSWLFGGMFALSTLGMLLSGAGRGGGGRRAGLDEDRRDYLRYLAVQRRRVRAVASEQRAALDAVHPDPAAWPAVLAAGRVWERRADDPDFGHVRIARGPQRLAVELVAPQTGPVEGVEPVTARALRRFLVRNGVVEDLPVALSLRGGIGGVTVWLEEGDPEAVRGSARAAVAQYVLWHGPDDALVCVLASPDRMADWDWVKWLPHAAHPDRRDTLGPVRMITCDPDELRRWWAGGRAATHLLIVVDGVADGPGPWASAAGISVLRVGTPVGRRPAASVVRVTVGAGRLERAGGTWLGRPDAMTAAEALALARRLARLQPEGVDPTAEAPRERGLPSLLGLEGTDVAGLRARRVPADRLRVPVGVDEHGAPVLLDLKESAHGGSGPHGLCVGATGSGKSELLRTLVLGLAATHASDELNLVLVDFKGGATFLGLAGLPHVSAVITNLAEELTLVDRMGDALAGEITRRQELLRAAGNLTGVAEYAAARAQRPDLPPLPALLVVVDEFSELLAQRPEMVDLLVTVGRLGRSLGLHLLLASQRLDEGRLRGLESHLSYRIALRTFSAAESRAVLGVPDAHHLPPMPGAAFLATGTDELVRFRAAYVSGAAGADLPGPPGRRRAHLFTAAPVPLPEETPDGRAAGPSVLEVLGGALAGGPPAHRVWLPPLDEPPALDTLPAAGGGGLRVAVGLVDRPYLQRHDPLALDLSGAAGHLAVVGGPRSGRSTALATVLLGLALTHDPAEVGAHVLDLGGGVLRGLAGLPHVGTVADRQEPELVRRVVAEVTAAVDRRERLFRDAGVASVEEFRARRAAGAFADEPCTDLLLVVDGHPVLRAEFEDVEARLLPLAAKGLSYGVHLLLSANRWTDLRPALKDLLGSRVELRLGEPAESEVDRRRAAAVPARPGHGLACDGAPMVLAAPRTTGADTAMLVASLAERAGSGLDPVRLLPERVAPDALPAGSGIPLGLDEERLGLVELDPAEPHLVCYADAECGKTTLLRLVARGIVERFSAEEARVVVVDHRRGLLGAVPESHLIGFASTPEATAAAARDLATSLRKRLPGPGVTPRELRERSWWSGPDVYLLVDDYDLVAPAGAAAAHPLLPVVELLAQAKDVGLHVVVARRSGGAGRAMFDPVLGRLRELAAPTLVMSGSPDEGPLAGTVKPVPLPPGRGTLVDRRRGTRRVQLAWLDPDDGGGAR